jgi:hypothetical protein
VRHDVAQGYARCDILQEDATSCRNATLKASIKYLCRCCRETLAMLKNIETLGVPLRVPYAHQLMQASFPAPL